MGPLGGLLLEDRSREWAGPRLWTLGCALPGPHPAQALLQPPHPQLGPLWARAGVLQPVCHVLTRTPALASPSQVGCLSEAPLGPAAWQGPDTNPLFKANILQQPPPPAVSPAPAAVPLASGQGEKVKVVGDLFSTLCPLSPRSTSSDKPLVLAKQKSLQVKTRGCLLCRFLHAAAGSTAGRVPGAGSGNSRLEGVLPDRCAEEEEEDSEVCCQHTKCHRMGVCLPRGCVHCGRPTQQGPASAPNSSPFWSSSCAPLLAPNSPSFPPSQPQPKTPSHSRFGSSWEPASRWLQGLGWGQVKKAGEKTSSAELS